MIKEGFKPTEGQAEAIDALTNWWVNGKEQSFIISGMAGTGKTAITSLFTESCKGVVPSFTAPTNEAARALELALKGKNANIRTSYNLLGLALSNRSFKQEIYQRKLPDDFKDFNLMIVDEASMAGMRNRNVQHSRDLLIDFAIASGIRVVWLGDWAQLPPVESIDGESPIFKLGISEIELTEVKRHEGAVLDFCLSLREVLKKPIRNFPDSYDKTEIPSLKRNAEGLAELPTDDFDKIVSGDGSIIVWTNQKTVKSTIPGVKEYNAAIRFRLFGKLALEEYILPKDEILFSSVVNGLLYTDIDLNSERLVEKLSLTDFVNAGKSIALYKIASTNTRATVMFTEKTTVFGVEVYRAKVQVDSCRDAIVYIPTFTGQKQLESLKTSLRKRATMPEHWEIYHAVSSLFCEAKHTYCMTAHRSQGSNIDWVYPDIGNMLQNRDRLVAFKLIYVAATRAKKGLGLIRGGK
jgi:hypothetical protein